MDRVTKQRDPKRQAAGHKGHERYMAKLKEDILKNVGIDSSSNSTNGGIDTTTLLPLLPTMVPMLPALLLTVVVP